MLFLISCRISEHFFLSLWQLAELQKNVRHRVSAEYWLRSNCSHPDNQLFDWGKMRLCRAHYGVGDAFATEADDQFRKKRDAEVTCYFVFLPVTYMLHIVQREL